MYITFTFLLIICKPNKYVQNHWIFSSLKYLNTQKQTWKSNAKCMPSFVFIFKLKTQTRALCVLSSGRPMASTIFNRLNEWRLEIHHSFFDGAKLPIEKFSIFPQKSFWALNNMVSWTYKPHAFPQKAENHYDVDFFLGESKTFAYTMLSQFRVIHGREKYSMRDRQKCFIFETRHWTWRRLSLLGFMSYLLV